MWEAKEIENNEFNPENDFKCSKIELEALIETEENIKKNAIDIFNTHVDLEVNACVERDKDELKEYKSFEIESREAQDKQALRVERSLGKLFLLHLKG